MKQLHLRDFRGVLLFEDKKADQEPKNSYCNPSVDYFVLLM